MTPRYSFEGWLKDKHAQTYTGTDDAMPDAFDAWLADLDNEAVIGLGEQYGDWVALQEAKKSV